ncbi:MAG: transposase, family [Methanofollis sp.]|nr:transposase, family [Methanofollis sp.]
MHVLSCPIPVMRVQMPPVDQAKTRRSRDGTWTKKGSKSYFGYKHPILQDRDHQLIRRITTTASLHDSRIDLSQKGETVYRDRGDFGVKPRASMDRTMHSVREKRRNNAIGRGISLRDRSP